jgi:membrane-associated HD superfamily phosphohydrolase
MVIGGGRMISDGGGGGSTKPPTKTKAQIEKEERDRAALRDTEARRDAVTASRAPGPSSVLDFINQANTFDPNAGSILNKPVATPPATDNSQAQRDRDAQAQRDRDAQAQRDRDAQAQRDRDAQAAIDEANRIAQAAIDEANRRRAEQEERDRQSAAAAAEQARQEALARMPKPLVTSVREPVKYATPSDVLVDTNDLPVDLILKLTLEKIGGLELISLVRHDTVNGQNIIYRPIKNVSQLAIEYNPQNMVKMPDSADSYFKNFPIKLENHILRID